MFDGTGLRNWVDMTEMYFDSIHAAVSKRLSMTPSHFTGKAFSHWGMLIDAPEGVPKCWDDMKAMLISRLSTTSTAATIAKRKILEFNGALDAMAEEFADILANENQCRQLKPKRSSYHDYPPERSELSKRGRMQAGTVDWRLGPGEVNFGGANVQFEKDAVKDYYGEVVASSELGVSNELSRTRKRGNRANESDRDHLQHPHRELGAQQGALHRWAPEETSWQKREGSHSPTRQGKVGLASEVLCLHQVGPARLESLQAEEVGSEETWHQGGVPSTNSLTVSLRGLRLLTSTVITGSGK
ncbi:hypothetical protein Efla_006702 [Eimeria flavescens]